MNTPSLETEKPSKQTPRPGETTAPPEALSSAHHAGLARQYLDLLLQGRRNEASELVVGSVEAGTSVKDIYLHVFQPAQHEVGRLWQTNRISVAQEHYCTAVTQLVMSQLYPRIFSHEKGESRMVATCVGGELHEIGIRMVADFYEMEGWDTYYLGANATTMRVLRTLEDRNADLLCISATMTFHLNMVESLVQAVRTADRTNKIKILVGGALFMKTPDLWLRVGADATAEDAQQAVDAGKRLIQS